MITKKIEAKSDLDLVKRFLKEIIVPSLNLGMSARKCADIIVDNLNENYEINLTQQKVADIAGVSIRSSARAITSMKEYGILEKKGAKTVPGFKLMPAYFPESFGIGNLSGTENDIHIPGIGICYIKNNGKEN